MSDYTVSSYVGFIGAFLAAWAGLTQLCWAQSDNLSPDARAILKRGTIEAGGTVGYWDEFLFPTEAHSASRGAFFIMPRIGVVVTDETDAGMLSGNLEVLVEPFYGRFKNSFLLIRSGLRWSPNTIYSHSDAGCPFGMLELECCGPISLSALLKTVAR